MIPTLSIFKPKSCIHRWLKTRLMWQSLDKNVMGGHSPVNLIKEIQGQNESWSLVELTNLKINKN